MFSRDFISFRLRLGAPPTPRGHEYVGVAIDLRVTPLDVLLGGAIAIGVVWAARTTRRPHDVERLTLRPDLPRAVPGSIP